MKKDSLIVHDNLDLQLYNETCNFDVLMPREREIQPLKECPDLSGLDFPDIMEKVFKIFKQNFYYDILCMFIFESRLVEIGILVMSFQRKMRTRNVLKQTLDQQVSSQLKPMLSHPFYNE